jgi:hypothetical protein
MLTSFAISVSGVSAAITEISRPKVAVTNTGVRVR